DPLCAVGCPKSKFGVHINTCGDRTLRGTFGTYGDGPRFSYICQSFVNCSNMPSYLSDKTDSELFPRIFVRFVEIPNAKFPLLLQYVIIVRPSIERRIIRQKEVD